MALLLERHEVKGLLDMKRAIVVTEAAFKEQGQGSVMSRAPTVLAVNHGSLRIVSGGLLESNILGARLGGASGFAKSSQLAVLCSSDTGELLTVMSYPFGALRTGATVALATKFLAREDAQVAGLIGTGRRGGRRG